MACGCKKKKTATQVLENVDYQPNGGGTVRLGLKETIRLPVRLPQALNGQDIIILANKRQQVPSLNVPVGSKPAMVIVGRNSMVDIEHKKALTDKWPKAFNG